MTPLADVFTLSRSEVLDFEQMKEIYASGYTRIPVYAGRKDRIVGVVFAKDLILVDPNDDISVASILPFCSRYVNAVPSDFSLQQMLQAAPPPTRAPPSLRHLPLAPI